MDKLLIVLGFSAGDAMQAERLLDYIAILNNKVPRGHCLLAAAPDTHAETQTKIKIAAEVAFESVELLAVPWPAVAHTSKTEAVNYLWWSAATHAARCYQWPFLWMEPDCVPLLAESWLTALERAYYQQPKRYLGSILASQDGKTRSLSRVAIYPRGAGGELKEFCAGKVPFEMASASMIVPRAEKTKLLQQLAFTAETDRKLIRDNAVLLHHDKQAVLLSALIDEASRPKAATWIDGAPVMSLTPDDSQITTGGIVKPTIAITDADVRAALDGHPTPISAPKGLTLAQLDKATSILATPPRDKRTREYKDWLKSQTSNAQT